MAKKDLTDKEKALRAVHWLLTVHDHQHNMFLEIDKVKKKYENDECALKAIEDVSRSVVGRMTAGDVDRVALEAIKAIAPEIYSDKVPVGEMFKKLKGMFG